MVLGNTTVCPEGYYCPFGTSFATENPCPVGTFNQLIGTVNFLNIRTPKQFVVITLKFELCGSTTE